MKKSLVLETKLTEYVLPVSGMKNGIHQFDFEIGKDFFAYFPDAYLEEGAITVHLEFDKRASMYVMDFDISGNVHTVCDRCSEEMWLAIENTAQLLVKFSDSPSKDADVVHIPFGTEQFDISQYIYEFICLAVPMIKTHEDIDEDCSEEVMRYFNEVETNVEESSDNNPFKDALKGFNFKE